MRRSLHHLGDALSAARRLVAKLQGRRGDTSLDLPSVARCSRHSRLRASRPSSRSSPPCRSHQTANLRKQPSHMRAPVRRESPAPFRYMMRQQRFALRALFRCSMQRLAEVFSRGTWEWTFQDCTSDAVRFSPTRIERSSLAARCGSAV